MQPSELSALLLANRGISTPDDQDAFLHPSYERDIHDPFLMPDMERAVVRIFEAIEAKEKIVIYADYDCDGIPGAVVLHDLFKKIGYENFTVYIPDRHDEGYGLNHDSITRFIDDGVALVITVDLGTTDVAEVAFAESNGINIVITDHHIPPPIVPRAFALVNPKVEGSKYPNPMLCGAGVAWKVAQAFLEKYREYFKVPVGWEKWLLDMAGLATLSDMVPLRGENRAIASYGMQVLRKSPRPGLQKLLSNMKIDQRHLSTEDLTFMIAPRLNAASRMDSPMRAFELLAENDAVRAGALATHLSKINDERKVTVATIMRDVHKKLEAREMREVIVIGNPAWRPGVLGLVAGKITEEYERPSFVWGGESPAGLKGSCRSDGSVNVVELMREVTTSFVDFGGHELAGGFSVSAESVHFLEDALIEAYNRTKREREASAGAMIDATLALNEVNMKNHADIERLAPFGCDNPKPVFRFANVTIAAMKQFGKEKNHLELIVQEGNFKTKAIAFFHAAGDYTVTLAVGASVTLLASFELSYFLGRPELRLRIVDII